MAWAALAPVMVSAPSAPVVSLADARAHLRVDHHDDDGLITGLVNAATSHVDGWTGTLRRCLVAQVWRESYGGFPACGPLRLRLAPVIEIVAVDYFDADGVARTLDPAGYGPLLTDAWGAYVPLAGVADWPSIVDRPDAVSIMYRAGYGPSGDDVPEAIRHAILLMVGHWYANREDVATGDTPTEMPLASRYLLDPFRRLRL